MVDLDMVRHAFNKASNVLVVTHVDPDGDAIGSLTAVGQFFQQREQDVTLACDDNVPSRFAYLPLAETVQRSVDRHVVYDLLVALDCGDQYRMGEIFATLPDPRPLLVNIDHHVTNTNFGDINLVLPQATSTAEILYRLFSELGVTLTEGLALSLLTGLVTDTLGFRTVGVTAVTLQTAADLVAAGADLSLVTMKALNLRSWSAMQMWRIGFQHLRLEDGLAWTAVTLREQQSVGFQGNSSQGLVNLLADIEEAAMGVVLIEMEGGDVKVGFRCRPPYDVAEVAVALGGGGHPLAAGCTISGPLAEAEARVVDLCQATIRRQKQTASVPHA